MKGLLHRLAARAVGMTVPVRSDALLPFGEAHLGWGEIDGGEAAAEPLVTATAINSVAEATLRPGGAAPATSPPPRHDRSPARSSDQGAEQRSAASPAALHSHPALEDLSRDAMPMSPVGESTSEAAAQLALPSRRPAAFRLNSLPPLLVPEVAIERPPHASDGSDTARGSFGPNAGSPPADDPAEVHVHIGRIEVTVAQEAPPPRKRSVRKQAPMPLDAYLAARSRR